MSSKKTTKSSIGENKTKPKAEATSTTNASATKELKTRIEQLENENNKLRTELKQQLVDKREQNMNDGDYVRAMLGQELFQLELKIQSLEKTASSPKLKEKEKEIKKIEENARENSHSSEKEKEAQKALETVNAAVKEKEAARNKLKEVEWKLKQAEEEVEKLRKTNASHSSERDKEAQKSLETVNAAVKEKEAATNELKEMWRILKHAEEDVEKLRDKNHHYYIDNCALKERNEKLSTELLVVKRNHNELEKENVFLRRSSNEAFAKLKEKEIKNSQMENEYKRVIEEKNKKLDELEKAKVHHQNSQGNHDMGSDEFATGVADVCAFCASKGKLNPALYNCKGCTEFGRYICGCCKENHDLFTQHTAARISRK